MGINTNSATLRFAAIQVAMDMVKSGVTSVPDGLVMQSIISAADSALGQIKAGLSSSANVSIAAYSVTGDFEDPGIQIHKQVVTNQLNIDISNYMLASEGLSAVERAHTIANLICLAGVKFWEQHISEVGNEPILSKF